MRSSLRVHFRIPLAPEKVQALFEDKAGRLLLNDLVSFGRLLGQDTNSTIVKKAQQELASYAGYRSWTSVRATINRGDIWSILTSEARGVLLLSCYQLTQQDRPLFEVDSQPSLAQERFKTPTKKAARKEKPKAQLTPQPIEKSLPITQVKKEQQEISQVHEEIEGAKSDFGSLFYTG